MVLSNKSFLPRSLALFFDIVLQGKSINKNNKNYNSSIQINHLATHCTKHCKTCNKSNIFSILQQNKGIPAIKLHWNAITRKDTKEKSCEKVLQTWHFSPLLTSFEIFN